MSPKLKKKMFMHSMYKYNVVGGQMVSALQLFVRQTSMRDINLGFYLQDKGFILLVPNPIKVACVVQSDQTFYPSFPIKIRGGADLHIRL